jgi:hypothetical protein
VAGQPLRTVLGALPLAGHAGGPILVVLGRLGPVGVVSPSVPRSPAHRLLARFSGSDWPSERDWERAPLLQPRSAPAEPALVSDGSGLPFPPSALDAPGGRLSPEDPATAALLAMLAKQKAPDGRLIAPTTEGWRQLARADGEVLFSHGLPPQLTTVLMRRGTRREGWVSISVTRNAPLRTTREGVRASGWRLDPTRELDPEDTTIRVLVTEQTRSGGARADRRLLPPDLHAREDELVLTMFVTPRQGFQQPASNPETAARVVLPEPIGSRELVDGALYEPLPPA